MKTLRGVDTSKRNREGWVPLPLLIAALRQGDRIALEIGGQRYIVGHAVRDGMRWWLVPSWRTDAGHLHLYDN